jgi:flagellar biogenesis protein FliO
VNLFWETVKMLAVLIIILTAAVYLIRLGAAKLQPGAAPAGTHIQVIDRMMFTQKSGVILIRAAKEYYLLGVAEHSVSLIKALDQSELDLTPAPHKTDDFRKVLDHYQNGLSYVDKVRSRFFQQGGRDFDDQ